MDQTETDAVEHRRSVCCPDDPTCPWPDACDECGEDWPCSAANRVEPPEVTS